MVTAATAIDLGVLSRLGRALADPTRRELLVILAIDGSGYPADLAERVGVTRSNLSNHLACLRDCGLVQARPEGRYLAYRLVSDELGELLLRLGSLELPADCNC